MKHEPSFAVSRFENRNGVTSWRIDGASMASASAATSRPKKRLRLPPEKAALEMKAMQSESGMQSVTTFLAADQFRETEAVFRRLAGRPRPLSFYVEFALANYREPVTQKLLENARAASLEEITDDLAVSFSTHSFDICRFEQSLLMASPISSFPTNKYEL